MAHLNSKVPTFLIFVVFVACSSLTVLAAPWQNTKADLTTGQTVTAVPNDQEFKQVMDAADVPGLSIARVRNAQFEWSRQFGRRAAMDESETATLIDAETVFEAASLGKPFWWRWPHFGFTIEADWISMNLRTQFSRTPASMIRERL